MIKYCLDRWNENRQKLEDRIRTTPNISSYNYKDLITLVTEVILEGSWDSSAITQIDNGDYQGTLLFLIPRNTYQPSEYDYLMTYVGYGSCSCCDTLMSILDYRDGPLDDQQVSDLMALCKDMVTNMIRPYNSGWRHDDKFDVVEMEN